MGDVGSMTPEAETMTEFEKWFDEEPTDAEKGYCMVAWRAALQWILDCDTGPEADEIIAKELGVESPTEAKE